MMALNILKDIPTDQTLPFDFGRDGKPCYISGPHDSLKGSKKILRTLINRVGAGNFDYIMEVFENTF